MSVVACQFLGRLGNCMFSYAFCRAYAERHNLELQTDPWLGQKIFNLNDPPIDGNNCFQRRDENTLVDGESNILFRSYCQQQKCMIYAKADCLRWFQLRREWDFALAGMLMPDYVGHRRTGDYIGYGYPSVSEASYWRHTPNITILTEENPMSHPSVPNFLSFLPDFYCMMNAKRLLRGNSSFSWWAATLNLTGEIFSPVMEGCEGGKEHDVKFVEGNWPRFRSDLEFITDLHLQP